MNNVSQISKASRLTEKEVHEAAEELKEAGTKISSIEIYKFLGRGSLTTITNFLKTWNQEATPSTTLPTLISLPEALVKSTEQLIIKVWAESQAIAEKEINSQREALRQAEAVAAEKIAEAEAFSEVQAKEIETLKAQNEEMNKSIKSWKEEAKINNQAYTKAFTKCELLEARNEELEKQLNKAINESTNQQKRNLAVTTENTQLKTKLEAAEKILQKTEIEAKEALKTAAKLEGELLAWKNIKPEEKPSNTKSQQEKQYKQTEWTEEN